METILFLNKNFYEYDRQIESELKKNGYNVISQSITPVPKKYFRFLTSNKKNQLINKQVGDYQKYYVEKYKNEKIDIVFMLAGQGMLEETVLSLKQYHPNAKFVWYIWDSVNNLINFQTLKKHFDCILCFDVVESEKYSIKYSPLFFSVENTNTTTNYDICMIGQYRPYRAKLVKSVISTNVFKSPYIYLKVGRIEKLALLLKKDKIIKYCHTKSLPYDLVIKKMKESSAILDMPAPNQSGLTMRTIETLGLRKKIITTNKYISKYDFFDEHNICIIDEDDINIPNDFINSANYEIDKNLIDYYSLTKWINRLITNFR